MCELVDVVNMLNLSMKNTHYGLLYFLVCNSTGWKECDFGYDSSVFINGLCHILDR